MPQSTQAIRDIVCYLNVLPDWGNCLIERFLQVLGELSLLNFA
jgi:hypothetical protein